MQNPVSVTLVGCGAISQLFYSSSLKALESSGHVRVNCLVDPNPESRAILAKDFAQAKQASDFDASGLNKNDLVIVASPPRFHAQQSISALQQGASVLCEKPMAMSVAECDAMIEARRKSSGNLAIGLYRRHFPVFSALRELIGIGTYGRLLSYEVREGSAYRWAAASASFSDPSATIGGVFYDVGVHIMDILLWLFGEPAQWSYADDAMGGLEANCRLELKYSNGLNGSVAISKDWDLGNIHRFTFEHAGINWYVGKAHRLALRLAGSQYTQDIHLGDLNRRPVLTEPQCFTRQILNVINAMHGTETILVTPEEGRRSLEFIQTSYARRTHLPMPWLSNEERAGLARGLSQLKL